TGSRARSRLADHRLGSGGGDGGQAPGRGLRDRAVLTRCPLVLRLQTLHREIGEVIRRLHPDEVAVESVFSAVSAGAALTLGHARGAVLVAAADLPVAEYSPRSVKQALTGYGAAGKGSVAVMVARRLGMADPPASEDASDALAVAICHLDARRAKARLARATQGRSG
ncbi:Crossover junction endodeoxyribonuclease RuvC, partial [Geodia barretti]